MMGQVRCIQAITKCKVTAVLAELLQYCALTISGSRATCGLYFPAKEALNIYFTPGKHGGDGEQAMPRDLMMAERILYEIVSKPITTNSAIICTN